MRRRELRLIPSRSPAWGRSARSSKCGPVSALSGCDALTTSVLRQRPDRVNDGLRRYQLEAPVMPLWAYALETVAARHVVEKHATRHTPRPVLRVRLRVHVDDRGSHAGGDVDEAGVIGDEH